MNNSVPNTNLLLTILPLSFWLRSLTHFLSPLLLHTHQWQKPEKPHHTHYRARDFFSNFYFSGNQSAGDQTAGNKTLLGRRSRWPRIHSESKSAKHSSGVSLWIRSLASILFDFLLLFRILICIILLILLPIFFFNKLTSIVNY